jgi:hypothetical protein
MSATGSFSTIGTDSVPNQTIIDDSNGDFPNGDNHGDNHG